MSSPFHEVVVGLHEASPGSKIQATTPDGEDVEVAIPKKAQRGDVIQFCIEGGGLVVRRLRKPTQGENRRSGQEDGGDNLLAWVVRLTRPYEVHVANLSGSLADGRVLLALLHRYFPDAVPAERLGVASLSSATSNFELALSVAEARAGCPRLLDAADVVVCGGQPDTRSMMTYLTVLRRHLGSRAFRADGPPHPQVAGLPTRGPREHQPPNVGARMLTSDSTCKPAVASKPPLEPTLPRRPFDWPPSATRTVY